MHGHVFFFFFFFLFFFSSVTMKRADEEEKVSWSIETQTTAAQAWKLNKVLALRLRC